VPNHWASFRLNYRFRETLYRIEVLPNSAAADGPELTLDGAALDGAAVPLVDDGRTHAVVVRLRLKVDISKDPE